MKKKKLKKKYFNKGVKTAKKQVLKYLHSEEYYKILFNELENICSKCPYRNPIFFKNNKEIWQE